MILNQFSQQLIFWGSCVTIFGLSPVHAIETREFFVDTASQMFANETTRQLLSPKQDRQDPKANLPASTPQAASEHALVLHQLQTISGDEERYIVVPGDILTISFHDRDKVKTANYQISGSGEIVMPLFGTVKVGGLSRQQAREELASRMQEYIRNPQIEVMVNNTGRIMIVGAVGHAGVYNLEPKLTVMEAILQAGGYEKRAAQLSNVIVMRGTIDRPMILKLDLKKMINKGDRSDNILLKPSDLIFVPTTLISDLDNFFGSAYRYLLIWYGLGGSAPLSSK